MTRSDLLNIAQTGVVATPQACILEMLISYLGPDTVYTNWNSSRFTSVRHGNSHDRSWLMERSIASKLLKIYYSQILLISDTVDSERSIALLKNTTQIPKTETYQQVTYRKIHFAGPWLYCWWKNKHARSSSDWPSVAFLNGLISKKPVSTVNREGTPAR